MKRVLIAVSMIAFITGLSSVSMAKELTGGVKAGINITNLSGDDIEDADSKMGIVGGGFITYKISDMFAIQPELLFSMKGCKFDEDGGDATLKLNYLEIPVLAKFLIPMKENIKPNVYLGPSLGILMSAKYDWEGGGESGTEDVKDDLKSVDFGLVFGGGVDFPIGEGIMTFDARYTMGLSSFREDDDDGTSYDWKNKAISFIVGYAF